MHKKLALYTLLSLTTSIIFIPVAKASQSWQSYCSNIKADILTQTSNQINASNYIVTASDAPSIIMHAGQMSATQQGINLPNDQFKRISNITSTALLALFLNHQMNRCSKQYYIDTLTPALNNLKNNGMMSFNWTNVIFKNTNSSFKANAMNLTINGQGNTIKATIQFSGLSGNPKNLPKAFFPNSGTIDISTTAQAFPLILAATSGNNMNNKTGGQTIPVTINALSLQNAITNIRGQGNITLNTKLNLTSANGQINISNIDELIAASKAISNSKMQTALILVKFAGRSIGNNTLQWDINWQGNLLKVNKIPIPVW